METANQTQPQPSEKSPSLGLADLAAMAQLIQITTSRGTWKAEELSPVGALYDKLVAFVEASSGTKQPADETQTQEDQNDQTRSEA